MERTLSVEHFIPGTTKITVPTVICCRSKASAAEFCHYLASDGWKWRSSGASLALSTEWLHDKEGQIVYYLDPDTKRVMYGTEFNPPTVLFGISYQDYIYPDEDDFDQKDEQEIISLIG